MNKFCPIVDTCNCFTYWDEQLQYLYENGDEFVYVIPIYSEYEKEVMLRREAKEKRKERLLKQEKIRQERYPHSKSKYPI